MKPQKIFQALIITLTLVFSQNLVAAEPGHIEFKNTVQKVESSTNKKGERTEKLVPATNVTPGDEVLYTIYFKNISDKAVSKIVITDPIPKSVRYKDGSAFGSGTEITYSVNGGKSYDKPEKLMVKTKEGKKRPAVADDYTNIRWLFQPELQPGKQGVVHFRAVVK